MTARRNRFFDSQKGDTLVEVMLATVIMSVVIMASFALVNRATRINQLSSERSESTNAMQYQAESLRLLRGQSSDGESSTWQTIFSEVSNQPPQTNKCANLISNPSGGSLGENNNAFFIDDNRNLSDFVSGDGPNIADRYYVWVEPYGRAAPDDDYIDFYIHACWDGPGGTGFQQSSIIYRLVK